MNIQNWFSCNLADHPDSEIAALELRSLLEFCTGLTATQQRIYDYLLSPEQLSQLNKLTQRLFAGEPLGYLIGNQPFWDITLRVTPATLIPRADTEVIIEQALVRARAWERPVIYDLGTGSGAIAIVLARELPAATVIGSDFSSSALEIARENANRYRLKNLTFQQGSWLQPFRENSADIIVSNPPYIAADDFHLSALQYEPQTALIAGNAGYQDLFTIIQQAPAILRSGGWLLIEHGYQQGEKVREFSAAATNFQNIQTGLDRGGRSRFTEMQKPTLSK